MLAMLERKRSERGAGFEGECLMAAGDLCRAEGRIADALGFYARIKAYERMLSLGLAPIIFEEIGDMQFFPMALEIFELCPAEIRDKAPLGMCVAWALKASGQERAFQALMRELGEMLKEDSPLRAEYLLLCL
jgi:LuxR family maltose regulon positive regulatory protein